MEQRHANQTQHASHGGDAPANAQQCAGPNEQHQHQKQSPDGQQPSSLNPTAARLLREAIVFKPAEGGGKTAADGSSDILAFARSVDRVDCTLE